MAKASKPRGVRVGEPRELEDFLRHVKKGAATLYVGIDPGAEGAFGLICGRRTFTFDIPTMKIDRKKTRKKKGGGTESYKGSTTVFNLPVIADFLHALVPLKKQVVVVLEKAQVQVKGKGATPLTAFQVGASWAMFPLVFTFAGFVVEETTPATWKRKMGLWGKDKKVALQTARSLFPDSKYELSLVGDHNRAEALLLAEFGRRLRGGGI